VVLSRRGPSPLPPIHPIAVLERYIRFATRNSEFVFCLPSDRREGSKFATPAALRATAAAPPLPPSSLACNARP
jgi:hypothetical protein